MSYLINYLWWWLCIVVVVVIIEINRMDIFIESKLIIQNETITPKKASRKFVQTAPIWEPQSSQSPCVISKRLFLLLLLPKPLVRKCRK